MSRRKAREYAFKVLFQVDQVAAEPDRAFNYLLVESDLPEKDIKFSQQLIQETMRNSDEIDKVIASYASDWAIDRMPAVDRNIMRLAACEILYLESVDSIIVMDEAIEIAKKYGGESSSAYINAILDRLVADRK
ncbi:transcription termination protein nusb [hydrocarbon metagenome]|uniref:Transcription termination protein nusb n=1 Tax=hydrocarbon metagenome TaxID=938273 RepID=A0A0W8E9D3_9ZZZZ